MCPGFPGVSVHNKISIRLAVIAQRSRVKNRQMQLMLLVCHKWWYGEGKGKGHLVERLFVNIVEESSQFYRLFMNELHLPLPSSRSWSSFINIYSPKIR